MIVMTRETPPAHRDEHMIPLGVVFGVGDGPEELVRSLKMRAPDGTTHLLNLQMEGIIGSADAYKDTSSDKWRSHYE